MTFSEAEWDAYERAKMAEQDACGALTLAHREGIEVGEHRGEFKARRKTLLLLLEHAGITLTEAEHARIEACTDTGTLDRWIKNVLSAKTAAEVLA